MLERRPPKRPYRSSGEAFVGGDDTGNSLNVVVSVEDDLGNGTVGGEPSYYQRSILIILTSVRDVYGNILNEGEHCLLAKVLPAKAAGEGPKTESILSKDAQRLLFRLFLRRTDWLREGRLEYQDISSIRGAIDELHTEGLVECTMHSVDDVISILQLDELRELARNLGIKRGALVEGIHETRRSKQQRLAFLSHSRPSIGDEANERIIRFGVQAAGPVVRLAPLTRACLDRLIALYFLEATSGAGASLGGEVNSSGTTVPTSLSSAILANLHRIRYPAYNIIRSRPVFSCREDWIAYDEALSYERATNETLTADPSNVSKKLVEDLLSGIRERWQALLLLENSSEGTGSSYFLRRYQAGWVYTRILASLVPVLERAKVHEEANRLLEMLLNQDVYCRGHRGRWWERRILNSQKHLKEPTERCIRLLNLALRDPHVRTSTRLALARRLAKLDANQSTRVLEEVRPDQIITVYADPEGGRLTGRKLLYLIPGDVLGSVEQLAMAHFAAEGWIGFHSEGRLYRMLFGLLLWDIIFADIPDVFQTPHQVAPLDLSTEEFYPTRKEALDRRLGEIEDEEGEDEKGESESRGKGRIAAQLLADAYYANYGSQALGMAWEEYTLPVLLDVCHSLGGRTLGTILRYLAEDYAGHCCGLPDLLLYREDHSDYLLVEVKSSNDRMSDAQRCWHTIFQEHSIKFILFRVLDTTQEGTREGRRGGRLSG